MQVIDIGQKMKDESYRWRQEDERWELQVKKKMGAVGQERKMELQVIGEEKRWKMQVIGEDRKIKDASYR